MSVIFPSISPTEENWIICFKAYTVPLQFFELCPLAFEKH